MSRLFAARTGDILEAISQHIVTDRRTMTAIATAVRPRRKPRRYLPSQRLRQFGPTHIMAPSAAVPAVAPDPDASPAVAAFCDILADIVAAALARESGEPTIEIE